MAKKRKYTKTQIISGDVRSRKFNGKWYDAMGLYVRKSDAIKGQKKAIEKGYLTRLTSYKGKGKFGGDNYWRLFIRKK
tara:strand:+ start:356 stop:589 length:234 start_codon:yes stop_codon:yes gene_type:complete